LKPAPSDPDGFGVGSIDHELPVAASTRVRIGDPAGPLPKMA
jgi:hypothetical protein